MSKKIDHTEFSRKGGNTTKEKYGPSHFSDMGKKGALAKVKKDPEYFKKISILGVAARKKKREEKLKAENSPIAKVAHLISGK